MQKWTIYVDVDNSTEKIKILILIMTILAPEDLVLSDPSDLTSFLELQIIVEKKNQSIYSTYESINLLSINLFNL